MLIEVRSSPDDTNNTASQLFQRFNETLILRPRSKIALVSALITTSAIGGFRVDGNNQTITLKIGQAGQVSVDIPVGDYTLKALCLEIQTALRNAVTTSGQIYKDLFYPDTEVLVAKSQTDIVTIRFAFVPQGFTSGTPNLTTSDNDEVTATNLNLNSLTTGAIMRSRNEINNVNVAVLSKEVACGFNAINSLLPYANGASTENHNAIFGATSMLGTTPRQQHIGLNQSSGQQTGEWLLPSANPYNVDEPLGRVWRFDNYTPVGGVNHGYDWVAYGTGFIDPYYLKATTANDFGVNTTHKRIDPALYDDTWIVREEADGNLGATIYRNSSGNFLDPAPDTLINRRGENNYDLEVNTNSRVQVRYNGRLLNTPADTDLTDGDGLRWVVNALDNSTITTKHPVPEIYKASVANPKWEEIPLKAGEVLPDVNADDVLVPAFHADGLVACGTIGNGDVTDLNTTPSFLASDMTISAQVGTFFAGEVLHQIGETTPTGGNNMRLLAVCGTSLIGGARGALTSVLVMGNGWEGRSYAQNMTIPVKGLKSSSTATITLTAVTKPCATIANGGTTYTQGNEYNFVLNAGGSPAQPPLPFVQSGRHTRGGKVEATAVGGGIITEVKFIDGGNGFMVGDTIEIQGNGGGDGAGDARITIQQVCEDVNQLVMNAGDMDTYFLNEAFDPFTPQNQINLDTQELGQMLDFVPLEFDGDVGNGVSQPIITSSDAPLHNNPANENILIDLPSMPINSRNSGRQGGQTGGNTDNHIATIPYQTNLNGVQEYHKQHYEPFNMIYHSMDNEADLNLNSFSVRLTNYDGTLRTDLEHPTQLTFSIQPDYI
tara:strand:- start:482 stop:2974 length:2493 start_codon:yes stop_codon:yes gene_type:complete